MIHTHVMTIRRVVFARTCDLTSDNYKKSFLSCKICYWSVIFKDARAIPNATDGT